MKRGYIFLLLILGLIIIAGCKTKEAGSASEKLNSITGKFFGVDNQDAYSINTGTLVINSNPKGYLFINGVLKCNDDSLSCSTPQTLSLMSGSYEVAITKPGYKDYSTTKTVIADQTTILNAILKKKVTKGKILFTSNPTPSKIYIDNVYKGVTPKLVSGVSFGSHNVKVEKQCYGSYVDTVTITEAIAEQGSLSINAVLPILGNLDLSSTPQSAKLYIDESFKGYTPKNVCGLSTGLHEVVVKKTGYSDYVANVNVGSGQSLSLNVELMQN